MPDKHLRMDDEGLLSTRKPITSELFLAGTILFLLWLINPFFCVVGLTTYLPFRSTNNSLYIFYTILAALTMGLIAYTTKTTSPEETDIARYYSSYQRFSQIDSINDFIIAQVLDGDFNIIFSLVNLALAKQFPEHYQLLPFFWTSLTYFFALLTTLGYAKKLKFGPILTTCLLVFCLLGCVFFYVTTETIKQCAATSIFGYALFLKWDDQKRSSTVFLIISIITHLSTFMFIPIYFLFNKNIFKYRYLILFAATIISFFNFNYLVALLLSYPLKGVSSFSERLEIYQNYSNWYLNARALIMLFLVCMMFMNVIFVSHYSKYRLDKKSRKLCNICFLAFSILLANRSNAHNFLRYVYAYFPFYSIILIASVALYRYKDKIYNYIFTLVFGLLLILSNFSHLRSLTLPNGNYANTYVEGKIVNLMGFSAIDYLSVKVKI